MMTMDPVGDCEASGGITANFTMNVVELKNEKKQ